MSLITGLQTGLRTGLLSGLNATFDEGDYVFKTRAIQTSAAQTLTLSGLAGDTDGEYIVKGRIFMPSGQLQTLSLRPNGLTTDLLARRELGNYAGDEVMDTVWPLARFAATFVDASGSMLADIEIRVRASKSLNGVAVRRQYWSKLVLANELAAAEAWSFESWGHWDETATELTSLVLHSSVASGIKAGSELICFTPTVSFTA